MGNDTQTNRLIGTIPGGETLLDCFDADVDFDGATMDELQLRQGYCRLLLGINQCYENAATVTFFLEDCIDVRLDGFSRRNLISSLKLRRVGQRRPIDNEKDERAERRTMEIKIKSHAGARGLIRANVGGINVIRSRLYIMREGSSRPVSNMQ